ncbi:MAG: glycosyltransferase [Paludibacteraceae bacterium]|nr:glycosyltransferase [Paludibacteraceae bacterium]
MRILLLHDELYPNTSANARIVYRLVDALIQYDDVHISILGCAQTKEQQQSTYKTCHIIHTPWNNTCRYLKLVSGLGKFKFLRYLLWPKSILYRIWHKRFSEPRDTEIYLWLNRHKSEFDVILCCSMPYYPMSIASCFGLSIPLVYYYMEPLINMLEQRAEWDTKATKIILPKIYASSTLRENKCKNVIAEFCNIVERATNVNTPMAETHDINLAFVGKFYPDARHPQYMFDIIEQLQNYGDYGLHIAGGFNGSFPQQFIDKYFKNTLPWLHYYGFVQPDVADSYLLQSDVLVHIANKTSSQMPSKILDYIATGKPILNFYYNDDCPTLPVLKPYPMALNVKMDAPITDELINQIVDFCTKHKGTTIPFSQIEQQYEQYTPKYVGKIFYDTLYAAINEFNK